MCRKKPSILEPDVMAHNCKNKYTEGRDRKIVNLRPVWAKVSKTLT
jgi:hypothetical protein